MQLGKIDVDVEPAADGAYACTARFRQRTEPPPDSPESMTDWTLKVKLRVWDAAPFLGAPPKMTAQLVHLRQTRLKACTPLMSFCRAESTKNLGGFEKST